MTPAEKLRAHLQAKMEKKPRTTSGSSGDNALYQFWNIADGATATIRLLPDLDVENPEFWVVQEQIKLPFAGQIGGNYATDRQVVVKVPCVDMFETGTCPIIAETKPWWKTEKEDLARLYYKKKAFIFQGFVVNSPFEEENAPENPIRRFAMFKSIFDIIHTSLMNPEMEDLPTDYFGGRDFKITKSKKGEYANYSTSTWSFRTRPLNEGENTAITQYGLFNLKDFLGPRPDANGIAMIKQMFHDSLAGLPFDFEAYGHAYRAYSNNFGGNSDAEMAAAPAPAPRAQVQVSKPAIAVEVDNAEEVAVSLKTVTEDAEPASKPVGKTQAADILARIRKNTMSDKA